ncbi:hypothetical protein Zmor_008818 [Zophobas morio]|uniref:Uncharacterized protein n=1 Tax=Zophobas morio TaxID=2755281 RepID=A0AA38HK65_9CUCU|nr:hypothetical protein Zmor_008818 [Zophobas morio]
MKTKSLNNTLVQLRKCCNHPYLFEDVEFNKEMMPAEFLMGRNLYRVSGKFELLDRTFEKLRASGHRVLVFCQMTRLMSVLEDYFEWKAYKYLRLDGSTSSEKRDHMLSLFNAERSEYFVFMLSTRAGGLGLNLQSADTVIIFDSDWNPHQDLQAQDRAHRIGQKREVRALRLVTTNSVEEYILEAALRKLSMDAKVIQAGRFDNKTTADVRRQLLEELVQKDQEQEEGRENLTHTLEEVNEMLARNDEEFELFQKIDAQLIAEAGGLENRFIKESELPPLLLLPEPDLIKSTTVPYGRGYREHSGIHYNETASDKELSESMKEEYGSFSTTKKYVNGRARKVQSLLIIFYKLVKKEDPSSYRRGVKTKTGSSLETYNRITRKKRKTAAEKNLRHSLKSLRQPSGARGLKRRGFISTYIFFCPLSNFVQLVADGRGRSKQKTAKCGRKKQRTVIGMPTRCAGEAGRSVVELFISLPSREEYPDYYEVIENLIDLTMIKQKIDSREYRCLADLERDVRLLVTNAKTYNERTSQVYKDATLLLKLKEIGINLLSQKVRPPVKIKTVNVEDFYLIPKYAYEVLKVEIWPRAVKEELLALKEKPSS